MRHTGLAGIAVGLLLSTLAASSAGALPFNGTLVIQIESFPAVSLAGSGSGDPTLPSIDADSFVGTSTVPVTGQPPVTQVLLSVTSHGAGPVGSGPVFAGTASLRGSGIGFSIVAIPLSGLGIPGATFTFHSVASRTESAVFGAWTTGVASVRRSHTGMTAACLPGGTLCPTAQLGGATANSVYFGGAAQIVLVAPINLWSSLANGLPSFGVLALNYVPEPGRLLLLGSGALVLASLGRARQRR